jgi:integrase
LFAPKVVKFLGSLKLPNPLPFTGVERFPRESQHYISRIDAGALLRKARQQLADKDPDSFLVVMLALAAGLRRGELDQLLWSNVDLDRGRIIIEDTEQGRVKSEESRGAVDIDQHTVELLRGFYARAASKFVIEGGPEARGSRRSWNRYRCEVVFGHVNWWLRRHGVKDAKPLHTLRKESGALVVSAHGIYEASRHLRHRDIATTAAHYADKKGRTVVDMGALLRADEANAENIIELPSDNPAAKVEAPKSAGTGRRCPRSVS